MEVLGSAVFVTASVLTIRPPRTLQLSTSNERRSAEKSASFVL
jgi:hypothetical protein